MVHETVGIVHPDLMEAGGAEAVCLNIIESLQQDYHIKLLTHSRPNLQKLNRYFDLDVHEDNLDIELSTKTAFIDRFAGGRFSLLKKSMLNRDIQKISDSDVIISAKNEIFIQPESIQYIHSPTYVRDWRPNIDGRTKSHYKIYDFIVKNIVGLDKNQLNNDMLISNSEWIKKSLQEVYGVDSKVIYPPVDSQFKPTIPWEERKNNFVYFGRVHPNKRVERVIKILKKVRSQNKDVELYVIGPVQTDQYQKRMNEIERNHSWIHVEGKLNHKSPILRKHLTRNKFAIFSNPYESFGICIAESIGAGMIPIIPNSGGQKEMVSSELLLYDNIESAAEKVLNIINNIELQNNLLQSLPNIEDKFGKDRFQTEFRQLFSDFS